MTTTSAALRDVCVRRRIAQQSGGDAGLGLVSLRESEAGRLKADSLTSRRPTLSMTTREPGARKPTAGRAARALSSGSEDHDRKAVIGLRLSPVAGDEAKRLHFTIGTIWLLSSLFQASVSLPASMDTVVIAACIPDSLSTNEGA